MVAFSRFRPRFRSRRYELSLLNLHQAPTSNTLPHSHNHKSIPWRSRRQLYRGSTPLFLWRFLDICVFVADLQSGSSASDVDGHPQGKIDQRNSPSPSSLSPSPSRNKTETQPANSAPRDNRQQTTALYIWSLRGRT